MIRRMSCKRLALMAVICFAVISCLGCFRTVGTYMVEIAGLELEAGDSFIEETRSNSVGLILPLCAVQIVLLNARKRFGRIVAVVTALLACLVTILISPNRDIVVYLMSGLIGYRSETTCMGYVAIALSILILGIQIILLVKRDDPVEG